MDNSPGTQKGGQLFHGFYRCEFEFENLHRYPFFGTIRVVLRSLDPHVQFLT